MFKYIAAYFVIALLLEIVVFNLWLYATTKNSRLISKYWANNFNTKDTHDLSKGQSFILKIISITRLLTIFALVLHVITLFIYSI